MSKAASRIVVNKFVNDAILCTFVVESVSMGVGRNVSQWSFIVPHFDKTRFSTWYSGSVKFVEFTLADELKYSFQSIRNKRWHLVTEGRIQFATLEHFLEPWYLLQRLLIAPDDLLFRTDNKAIKVVPRVVWLWLTHRDV